MLMFLLLLQTNDRELNEAFRESTYWTAALVLVFAFTLTAIAAVCMFKLQSWWRRRRDK